MYLFVLEFLSLLQDSTEKQRVKYNKEKVKKIPVAS